MANKGGAYIAYQGKEYSLEQIKEVLENNQEDYEKIKIYSNTKHNVILAKNTFAMFYDYSDYYFEPFQRKSFITVCGYNKAEYESIIPLAIDSFQIPEKINELFSEKRESFFSFMSNPEYYIHFSGIGYDPERNELIAGLTSPKGKYTQLFYGYTKKNHEIMLSNVKEILLSFCDVIKEMANNTYMKNGAIYNIDSTMVKEREIQDDEDEKQTIEKAKEEINMIKKTKENGDYLIDGLNFLLTQITNEIVKEQIEENVANYLASKEPKKRIEEYLLAELDNETQKKVLEIIGKVFEKENIEEKVIQSIKTTFDDKLKEFREQIQIPTIHIIKLNDTIIGQTSGGFYHEKFEEILAQVQLNEPIMLVGPAGSGKNIAVKQVADALGLHMYYTNNASNEFKLTGFIDAGGNYRETEFYKAFKYGGLFNLDEVDASDPTALIVINSALANGYMAFPHETIECHKDFRIVAAANTWGKGSDMQYVGRNALDGATLDRFDNIYMDYDRNLERNLYPNEEVLEFMWEYRDAVEKTKIQHIVSTRGIGKVYKKEICNFPVEQILRTNVVRNLGQDDVNTIIGNMTNISASNKYYEGLKKLVLRR